MATKSRSGYFDSAEGIDMRKRFKDMVASNQYNTQATYSANSVLYPDNLIPFIDKHMNYLNSHPGLEANKYLANIKLITRAR